MRERQHAGSQLLCVSSAAPSHTNGAFVWAQALGAPGTHRHRFDEEGHGRGLDGRDAVSKGGGEGPHGKPGPGWFFWCQKHRLSLETPPFAAVRRELRADADVPRGRGGDQHRPAATAGVPPAAVLARLACPPAPLALRLRRRRPLPEVIGGGHFPTLPYRPISALHCNLRRFGPIPR